jgi:Sec-independent protein secretion pathway component TatC
MKALGSQGASGGRRRRSRAWIYYGVLAVAGIIAAPSSHGQSLWATLVCGAYAVYIFCGGKYVWWVW